jgi:TRAP-type C4-dicarboxylate transport system permease small subunit
MRLTYRVLSRFADALILLGGLALLLMMLHVTADVLAKYLLGTPILGTLETVTHYYMVAVVFLPIAMVQKFRGQIVVDVATQHLSPRRLALVEATTSILTLIFVVLLAWHAGVKATNMAAIREKTNAAAFSIDIWPSRWFVVLGCVGMASFLILQILNDFARALRGRPLFDEAADPGSLLEE